MMLMDVEKKRRRLCFFLFCFFYRFVLFLCFYRFFSFGKGFIWMHAQSYTRPKLIYFGWVGGWMNEWWWMTCSTFVIAAAAFFWMMHDDALSLLLPIQSNSLSLLSLIQSKPKHNINKTHTASRAFLLFVLFRFSISFRSSIWLSSECSRFSILKFNKNP